MQILNVVTKKQCVSMDASLILLQLVDIAWTLCEEPGIVFIDADCSQCAKSILCSQCGFYCIQACVPDILV